MVTGGLAAFGGHAILLSLRTRVPISVDNLPRKLAGLDGARVGIEADHRLAGSPLHGGLARIAHQSHNATDPKGGTQAQGYLPAPTRALGWRHQQCLVARSLLCGGIHDFDSQRRKGLTQKLEN